MRFLFYHRLFELTRSGHFNTHVFFVFRPANDNTCSPVLTFFIAPRYSASSPWSFNHRRTTLGIGHAVDSPCASVRLYMSQQHL